MICCPACDVINFEIDLSFLIKPFSYVTKNSDQKSNIIRTEGTFNMEYKAFFTIFKGLSFLRNCLRPKGGPLRSFSELTIDLQ